MARVSSRLTGMGWMAVGLALLVLLAAANTNANLLYLAFGTMSAALALGWLGARRNLAELSIELEAPARVAAGRGFSLLGRGVSRRGARGPWVVELPQGLTGGPVVLSGSSPQALSRVRAPRRGRQSCREVTVHSEAPLGLVRAARRLPCTLELLVVPPVSEARPEAPGEPIEGVEDAGARAGDGTSLRDLRPYVAGDNPRRIHWKASAKRDWPLVKEFHDERASRLTMRLEDAVSAARSEEAYERAIARMASVAAAHLSRGDVLDLVIGRERLRGLSGQSGLALMLEALALAPAAPARSSEQDAPGRGRGAA